MYFLILQYRYKHAHTNTYSYGFCLFTSLPCVPFRQGLSTTHQRRNDILKACFQIRNHIPRYIKVYQRKMSRVHCYRKLPISAVVKTDKLLPGSIVNKIHLFIYIYPFLVSSVNIHTYIHSVSLESIQPAFEISLSQDEYIFFLGRVKFCDNSPISHVEDTLWATYGNDK